MGAMMATKATKKSEQIKGDLARVRITARTGRLPIVSDDVEWINPTTKRVIPGVVLEFGNEGVCELDPVKDADTVKLFREWLADGRDDRIVDLGVMEIAPDALLPPFPAWVVTDPAKCIEMVATLGLDPEICLRFELQRGSDARPKVVKALESQVDEPPVEDPLSEPAL